MKRHVIGNDDSGYWEVHDKYGCIVSGIESESEALLIAAAPDLLEAARVILASIDEQGTPLSRSAIEDTPLRAAIAKAEGAK